jgi:hypothetical protein
VVIAYAAVVSGTATSSSALILDGLNSSDGPVASIRTALTEQIESHGWQIAWLKLAELDIHHCVGCFGCWVQTPGECVIDDPARDIARRFIQADLVVLLTPVTFGGYSYHLKKALDRIICLMSPMFLRIDGEVHHRPRYARYPRLLGIGVTPDPEPRGESIFSDLVARNAINMHAPAHAVGVVVASQPEAARDRVAQLIAGLERTR